MKTKFITKAGIIAALYVVLTFITNLFGLADKAVQVRFSEALTILPVVTPAAIPGVTLGCLISNIVIGCTPIDIVFGTLATFIGAIGTYFLKKNKYLAVIPPILANTIIIPFVLKFIYSFEGALWYFVVTVGIGEILSCGVLGVLLYNILEKKKIF